MKILWDLIRKLREFWLNTKETKALRAARIAAPRLDDLFKEVERREKIAECQELGSMLDKVRLLLDNVEWEDELEWDLVNHIWNRLLNQFKKRCRKMWIQYTDELGPRCSANARSSTHE